MDRTGESFKGLVHATVAGLVAAMALYNLMEYGRTGVRRNGTNAVIYGALWGFETYQTRQHWRG